MENWNWQIFTPEGGFQSQMGRLVLKRLVSSMKMIMIHHRILVSENKPYPHETSY